eukprot:CAMPEP_0180795082 /NCGR_PEP_ID=MMETSP1038_2-20121128/55998_1 /TAXON_ID=632150 /ORGANISM="Azadinium spinosum, Strain 3D9" /LENGTH=541 /DNA_ID=CAMNT_0022833955 /DNA_START=1 /DNA_END=1622 /DNA_ORIENTATION=+
MARILLSATFSSTIVLAAARPAAIMATINGSTEISRTSDGFVCVNLDWWPPSKCDYGRCPWGEASILNIDLASPRLRSGMRALAAASPSVGTLTLRLGGSMADYIQYNTSAEESEETRLGYVLFDWSRSPKGTNATGTVVGKCLQPQRLLDLMQFCSELGCRIAFGIAAMPGRWLREACPSGTKCWHLKPRPECCTTWDGIWDDSNARALLSLLKDHGVMPWALEFGNELVGKEGVQAHISPASYHADFVRFANLVHTLWPPPGPTPLLVTPDSGWDDAWQTSFLALSPPADVVSRHEYTIGAGVDVAAESRAMDPAHLDHLKEEASLAASTFKTAVPGLEQSIPPSHVAKGFPQLWMGEGGGCYNSGRPNVTNTFMSSFWYLDNMAVEAQRSHAAYCRQTFVGGSYSLLDTDTLAPNPDFFAAVLWRHLMGTKVLNVSLPVATPTTLRVYAHCLASPSSLGGVALLLLNLDTNITSDGIALDMQGLGGPISALGRDEYHMEAPAGDRHSRVVMLNGVPLREANATLTPHVVPRGSDVPLL